MEVHHHPDLHHKAKSWKGYFLEFLMIFLAVTMGFIAENIREHFLEKKHEKGYMLSLIRDLQQDTADINRVLTTLDIGMARADTIIDLFRKEDYKNSSGEMYYHARLLSFRNLWKANDGTIQQLNYAGGLRMIENKILVDSIQEYISRVRDLAQILSLEDVEVEDYRQTLGKIFSGFVFDEMTDTKQGLVIVRPFYNPDLIDYDKKIINDMIVKIMIVKSNRGTQVRIMKNIFSKATSLIKMIKNDYHLE